MNTWYPRKYRRADSEIKFMPKYAKEPLQRFVPCPCCSGHGKKYDRVKNIWRDCVGCLKTPGCQPVDKDFNGFDN